MDTDQKVTHEDRLLAALAYPLWWAAFPLLLLSPGKRERKFFVYHAYQGLFLGLALWVGGIALWTGASVIGRIALFGILLYPALKLAQWVAALTTVYATALAWLGVYVQIPFITEFARPYISSQKPD